MKPVVTRLYAVLVALVLVSLVAWSGTDWYQRQHQAQAHLQAALRQAAGTVSDLTIHNLDFSPEVMGQIMTKMVGTDGRWKVVLLYSPERGTEYYRGPRTLVAVDKAVPQWDPRPLSEVKASIPVFRTQGDPLQLEGVYEFYGRLEVFGLLEAAAIATVLLVLLTGALMFVITRQPEPQAPPTAEEEEEADLDALDQDPLSEPLEPFAMDPDPEAQDEYWFDENLTLDDLPPLEDPSPIEAPRAQDPPAAGPSLFSPTTGLGWESFLTTRLENELQRSTEQNWDTALILFAIKEGSVDSRTWGETVRGAFPSVDLDFEYEGGAAVVLPGRSLEQALKAAKTFIETCDRVLGEALVHAGVAARSGRLLSAQTLLSEAGSAKRRSLAGTVRVLGLKTDPDRYREHLTKQSESA